MFWRNESQEANKLVNNQLCPKPTRWSEMYDVTSGSLTEYWFYADSRGYEAKPMLRTTSLTEILDYLDAHFTMLRSDDIVEIWERSSLYKSSLRKKYSYTADSFLGAYRRYEQLAFRPEVV